MEPRVLAFKRSICLLRVHEPAVYGLFSDKITYAYVYKYIDFILIFLYF